jgi:hypothetical protein
MNAKVKVVIGTASIEVEGSEEFVERNLSWFRERTSAPPTAGEKYPGAADVTNASQPKVRNEPKEKVVSAAKPKRPKNIQAERFDVFKSGDRPSLEEFLEQKKPGETAAFRIVVIAYYIVELLKNSTFTEGQIEYAYKALDLKKRPTHLRQIIINLKNDKDWFEPDESTGAWRLTRAGEIFVSEKMPQESEA